MEISLKWRQVIIMYFIIDNRALLQSALGNDKWKNDEKLLSFSHRAKDGVWKV